jgi:hypothetical protein
LLGSRSLLSLSGLGTKVSKISLDASIDLLNLRMDVRFQNDSIELRAEFSESITCKGALIIALENEENVVNDDHKADSESDYLNEENKWDN